MHGVSKKETHILSTRSITETKDGQKLVKHVKYFTLPTYHNNDQLHSRGRGVYKNYTDEVLLSAIQVSDKGFHSKIRHEIWVFHSLQMDRSQDGARQGWSSTVQLLQANGLRSSRSVHLSKNA